MNSRERILNKLRTARAPFEDVPPVEPKRRMVPLADENPAALLQRFVDEAEKLHCYVYRCDAPGAVQQVVDLCATAAKVISWDTAHLPLDGLHAALAAQGVTIADPHDGDAPVGITGADAALASTGSVVLMSGPGKPRTASLLPDRHIAVMTPDQLVPDLETWLAAQRADDARTFRGASATTIVSGPSKTADIAQELIRGAHGPREVHIVIVE